jgi:NAD(P)H-hydrate epimerase
VAIPLQDAAGMRELDRATIEDIGIPGAVLMEIAGRGCAEAVEELLHDDAGSVAVVCGKGNNGGDGFVAARHLHHAGHQVDVFLIADPDKLRGDAKLNWEILDKLKLAVWALGDEKQVAELDLSGYDVILDAVFGTGLSSDVRGPLATAIERINASGVLVVAVDIPSGISADTGRSLGTAVQAAHTVTFGYPKLGHVIYPGAAHTGDIIVVDIGIPPDLVPQGPGSTWLLCDEDIAPHFKRRRPDAHKGRFGHLVVVAGSIDKPGAAGLCCRAAVRTGAGLVTLAASPEVLARVVVGATELMGVPVASAQDVLSFCEGKQAVCIGPGLSTSREAADLVRRLVSDLPLPMVVDADGLNNLEGRLDRVRQAPAKRILTPHPGEMARLLGVTVPEVQKDRLGTARKLATECGCVVVLKGAGTVVADADGTAFVVPSGNPGMASGGTGDVLTGIIGSLLAQGHDAGESACVGAFVHGKAGDRAMETKGEHGLSATDLIEALPSVLSEYENEADPDSDYPIH